MFLFLVVPAAVLFAMLLIMGIPVIGVAVIAFGVVGLIHSYERHHAKAAGFAGTRQPNAT